MIRKKGMFFRCLAMVIVLGLLLAMSASAEPAVSVAEGKAKALLLMETSGGTVLYAENERTPMEPASVTKVMTLLLTMEALEDGRIGMEDEFTVSGAAAAMGGSQVYMEAGEKFTLHELLKCIAVVSANDACVVVAEALAGSEAAFVSKMNERAAELGMTDTTFKNCTGLPAEGHLCSARDIAIMSQELLRHEKILEYTQIWMDSIRGGDFGLANTNKLLKNYAGITGLKTGSTDAAGFCITASAERDGMELVAVVLGSDTSADRFNAAAELLDYGFANYARVELSCEIPEVRVDMGRTGRVCPVPAEMLQPVVEKERAGAIMLQAETVDKVSAPVAAGQKLGELIWRDGEEVVARAALIAAVDVPRIGYMEIFGKLLKRLYSVEKAV